MGEGRSYFGVGLRLAEDDFESISARLMTFYSSRMLPDHSYCRSRFPSSCVSRDVHKILEELREEIRALSERGSANAGRRAD